MDFNDMEGVVRDRTLMVILELLYVYLWFYLRGNNVTSSFCCYGTGTTTHYGLRFTEYSSGHDKCNEGHRC